MTCAFKPSLAGATLVEARRKDKRFRRLLEDSLARHQRLLDLLRGDEP
ncbi:MAG TPA: hypothetical protein VGH53_13535 [Streptosporangiaceae bacterium]